MRERKQRGIHFLLAFMLVLGLLPVGALAQELTMQTAQQVLQQAAVQLSWESIKGSNLAQDQVTTDLMVPSSLTVQERQVAIDWHCDDATMALSVSNYYGAWGAYVDRPAAQNASSTLTAKLSLEGELAEKTFQITVLAEGVSPDKSSVVSFSQLLTAIAGGYSVSTDPWVVMEMAAYSGVDVKGASYDYAAATTLVFAELAAGRQPDLSAIKRLDVSGAYGIYTIPYLSMAYQAAGEEGVDGHAPQQLKTAMVDYLNQLSTNFAGVDEVAPLLTALAADYKGGDSALDAAVDGALLWLSGIQGGDGTFAYYGNSNANSTALVIVALSALGVDAHSDARFIKNQKSAIEGLFSFALPTHQAFGYKGNVTANQLSTEQGFRALVAYARMKDSGAPYSIYIHAKDSMAASGAVQAPNISATTKPPEGGGGAPSDVNITVRVMIPPANGAQGQYTYRHNAAQYTNLLGEQKSVTVRTGTSALSVLKQVLNGEGIPYTIDGGYIRTLGTLAEGDHGVNSGWQYKINALAPSESSDSYTFSHDATMLWYYTDDYTKEQDAEHWITPPVLTQPTVERKPDGTYQVSLPKTATGATLVTIPKVGAGQRVVLVHPDGTEEVVKKSIIQDGTAYLLLSEHGLIKIVQESATFPDVAPNSWYYLGVQFGADRGLFSGVGDGQFDPEGAMNRAMLVTILHALEAPSAQQAQSLPRDVSQEDWYWRGVDWAMGQGLAVGDERGLFAPADTLTREQMALMLYGYAKLLGMKPDGTEQSLAHFSDGAELADWARDAMAWAVSTGIVSGQPDGTLNPKGTVTRGEASVMLRSFVAQLLKA